MEQYMFAEALFADLILLHPMLCNLAPVVHMQSSYYDSTIGKTVMFIWFTIRKPINSKIRTDSSKFIESQDSFKKYLTVIGDFALSSTDSVQDKIFVLSASLLEVISFLYRRGMTNFIYHAPHYWLHMFQLIDSVDFNEHGGWHGLKLAAKKQAENYDKMKDQLQMQYWLEDSCTTPKCRPVKISGKLHAQDSAETSSGKLVEEASSSTAEKCSMKDISPKRKEIVKVSEKQSEEKKSYPEQKQPEINDCEVVQKQDKDKSEERKLSKGEINTQKAINESKDLSCLYENMPTKGIGFCNNALETSKEKECDTNENVVGKQSSADKIMLAAKEETDYCQQSLTERYTKEIIKRSSDMKLDSEEVGTLRVSHFKENAPECEIKVTQSKAIEQDKLPVGESQEGKQSQSTKAENLKIQSGMNPEREKNITMQRKTPKTLCRDEKMPTKSPSQHKLVENTPKLLNINSSNKKVTPKSKPVIPKEKSEAGKDEKNRRLSLPKRSSETSKPLRRTNSAKTKSESKTDKSNKNLPRPGSGAEPSSKQSNKEKHDSKTDKNSKRMQCLASGTQSSSKQIDVKGNSVSTTTTTRTAGASYAKGPRKQDETHREKSEQSSSESVESAKTSSTTSGQKSYSKKTPANDSKSEKPRWR